MPQTAYSIDLPAVSYPGQLADSSLVKDALSVLAVAAAIPFGVFVTHDTANTGGFDKLAGKVPAASTDITVAGALLGVSLAEQVLAQDPATAVPTWPINSVFSALRKGRVWMLSESDVTDGGAVFVRFATGAGGSQKGAVRKDADTATAAQAPGAVFRGSYASAGYVVVELDLV